MKNKSFIAAFVLLALLLKASASFGYFTCFSSFENSPIINPSTSCVFIKSKSTQGEKNTPQYIEGDVKYQNEEEDDDDASKFGLSFGAHYFSSYNTSIINPFIISTSSLPFTTKKPLFILFSRLII